MWEEGVITKVFQTFNHALKNLEDYEDSFGVELSKWQEADLEMAKDSISTTSR